MTVRTLPQRPPGQRLEPLAVVTGRLGRCGRRQERAAKVETVVVRDNLLVNALRRAPIVPKDVMKDLKADWRRWTRVERVVAVFIALGMSSMVPVLLLLGEG